MLDHYSIGVRDLGSAMSFYDAVLAPLGYGRREMLATEGPAHPFRSCSYGPTDAGAGNQHPGAPFWLEERPTASPAGPGFHIGFAAPDRAAVHAFHAAGLAHGGHDAGAPGLRTHYGPDYYAAFLLDPEGWRIEAVTFNAR